MNVIVLGGSGMFGRKTVLHMLRDRQIENVVSMDIAPPPAWSLQQINEYKNKFHFVRGSVADIEDILNAEFGPGAVRVICPITDPFVRHHGALGSFVRVYRKKDVPLTSLIETVRALPGIDVVLPRAEASALYELPWDREADLVVTGDRNTALGATAAEHDLSALAGHRLRSHGGAFEQTVPFLLSQPLTQDYLASSRSHGLRNFAIFEFALNRTAR